MHKDILSSDTIPFLDIRRFDQGTAADKASFVDELGKAYREYGFAGVTHHGIPDAVTTGAYDVIKAFFALPLEVRVKYEVKGAGGARGYTRFGVEHAKDHDAADLKEFWHVGRELAPEHPRAGEYRPNVWPTEIAGFRETTLALWTALDDLGRRMLRAIALDLGVDERYFEDKVDHGNSILRPIHYPPIQGDAGDSVRSAQHEDINLITLLVGSGEPGLQVLSRKGEWIPVDTIPGTIVCNVGDMLQRLTNHVYPSTTHRVVNPPPPLCQQPRYSIPYFLHPNSEFLIKTLEGCITAQNPDRYPEPITADGYLHERLVEIGLLPADAAS